MKNQTFPQIQSFASASLSGSRICFILSVFYGAAFTLIAVPRASLQILASLPPSEGLWPTLLANAVEIFILAIQFALGFGLVAALIGAVTFGLVHAFARLLPGRGALLGPGLALLVSAGLHLMLGSLEGLPHAILFRSFPTYLFWLGLPCLIFTAAATWFGSSLNRGYLAQ